MSFDRAEGRRGQSTQRKGSTKHPYAAIEHRVIDSEAYAALTFSSRSLLVLLTRQLTKDNNGHLQATAKYLKGFGFASEHTVSRSIKELIAHGFLYRTRYGGYQQGASQYAVTWLSITNRNGLFLDGFQPCAWRDWKPADKKTPPSKMQSTNCINGIRTTSATALYAVGRPPKSADTECVPIGTVVSARRFPGPASKTCAPSYATPSLIRRQTTGDRGQLRAIH
jgi:hypothetical protein